MTPVQMAFSLPASTTKVYLTVDSVFLGGTAADGALSFDGIATPVAGAALVGSTYTLTRDINASTIAVATGVTIAQAGFYIYHTGAITLTGTGSISRFVGKLGPCIYVPWRASQLQSFEVPNDADLVAMVARGYANKTAIAATDLPTGWTANLQVWGSALGIPPEHLVSHASILPLLGMGSTPAAGVVPFPAAFALPDATRYGVEDGSTTRLNGLENLAMISNGPSVVAPFPFASPFSKFWWCVDVTAGSAKAMDYVLTMTPVWSKLQRAS